MAFCQCGQYQCGALSRSGQECYYGVVMPTNPELRILSDDSLRHLDIGAALRHIEQIVGGNEANDIASHLRVFLDATKNITPEEAENPENQRIAIGLLDLVESRAESLGEEKTEVAELVLQIRDQFKVPGITT